MLSIAWKHIALQWISVTDTVVSNKSTNNFNQSINICYRGPSNQN